jgi:hypothetical protein
MPVSEGLSSAPSNYELKKINFLGREVSIVMQNQNGPCPLISIGIVLINHFRLTPVS